MKNIETIFTIKDLEYAIKHKLLIYNKESDELIAISHNHGYGRIEPGYLVNQIKEYFEQNFKNPYEQYGELDQFILSLLVELECINSALEEDTPEFKKIKKDIFEYINNFLKSKNKDVSEDVRRAINVFMQVSKENIPFGDIQMGNHTIILNEQKECFRRMFMVEMLNSRLVDYDTLERNDIISEMDFEEFEVFLRNNNHITIEECKRALFKGIKQSKTRKEILDYYFDKDKKFYIKIANDQEIIDGIYAQKLLPKEVTSRLSQMDMKALSPEYIKRLYSVQDIPTSSIVTIDTKSSLRIIPNRILNGLNEIQLVELMCDPNRKYGVKLQSQDFIDMYISKLSLDAILKLQNHGYILPENIIDLIKFKSLEIVDPEEYSRLNSALIEFYDYNRLKDLSENQKLNKVFVEKYTKMVKDLPNETRKEYEDKIFSELKEEAEGTKSLAKFIKSGIRFSKRNDYTINKDSFGELYLEEDFDIKEIIEFYKEGFISKDTMHSVLTDNELYDAYESGEISIDVLVGLDIFDLVFEEELENGKIDVKKVMELYSLNDELDIQFLNKAFDSIDIKEEQLSEYIPDDISKEKVEELFVKFYISHDEISNLVVRNIITQEEANLYAKKLATHEAYDAMFRNADGLVKLTEITEGEKREYTRPLGGGGNPGRKNWQTSEKIDIELKEELLSKLGFSKDKLRLVGTQNTLDGYTVCPNEDLGVVIFINAEKPQNATYIMSLQQGMYWITKIQRELLKSGQDQTLLSEATKGKLRETEHVKVRNDCAGWGRNIISSIKALAPEKMKKVLKDKKYHEEIDAIINLITEDYERNREEF